MCVDSTVHDSIIGDIMICSYCGYEIKGKVHPIKNGEKFVCDRCWDNPDLFFAEKLNNDSRLRLLAKIANDKRTKSRSIKISVIRFHQKSTEMYMGKMKVKELLHFQILEELRELAELMIYYLT